MSKAEKKIFTPHPPSSSASPATRQYIGRSLGVKTTSQRGFISLIRSGFDVNVINTLSKNIGLPEKTLIQYAAITPRTLSRRKDQGKLHTDESDRIARIGLLLDEAIDLFKGDSLKASEWVKSPKKALGGSSPLEYIDTEVGFQEVQDLIGRIKHGVFS